MRDLLARRDDARGGAGGQARAGLPEARPQARPARARRRLAAGARSRSTPRSATASTSPASRCRRRRSRRARRRAEEAGVADRIDFRVADYRELAGESFDAVASIGMVEHVGAEQMDEYARRLRGALRPGRAAAQPRHRQPAPGGPAARATSPRATSSPTARRSRSRACCSRSSAPASRRTTSRASATTTPRRCATGRAALDEQPRRGDPARGARARARVAAVPAGGAQRLRDRLHLDLPGPRLVIGEALVRVHRGAGVESEHRVAWATTDRGRGGRAAARAGRSRPPTPGPSVFARSAAKPFQALAGVRAGVPERFGLATEHLAMACASHGGSDAPRPARARDPLRRRPREADLACGAGRAARPGRGDRAARGRRPPDAGAPQLLGQARVRARLRDRRGLADRGLHRQGPPAPGRDGERARRGDAGRAGRAHARHRRLRDAHVLGADRAARRGVRAARLGRPRARPASGSAPR